MRGDRSPARRYWGIAPFCADEKPSARIVDCARINPHPRAIGDLVENPRAIFVLSITVLFVRMVLSVRKARLARGARNGRPPQPTALKTPRKIVVITLPNPRRCALWPCL